MSQQHTPEPWSFEKTGSVYHRILSSDGRPVAANVGGGHEKPFSPDELEFNARRIVACVNACAGISTRELELMTGRMSIENQLKARGLLGKSTELKAARRSKFARQRDKLLEVLKECDEAMVYMSEYDIPLCLPERVKAAIASVEGGA